MEIIALKNEISREVAEDLLLKREHSIKIELIKPIYYPYLHLIALIKTRILSKEFDGNISCLVDMVNGVEAITGDKYEKEKVNVSKEWILDLSLNLEGARKQALRFIRHVIIQKMKVLSIPKVTPIDEEIIYKPYWIITCSGKGNEKFHLLMDSIGGQYQLLEP